MTKLIVTFRSFANAPKKSKLTVAKGMRMTAQINSEKPIVKSEYLLRSQ
jgi:hypothetical protein